jgi:hypothetical protein
MSIARQARRAKTVIQPLANFDDDFPVSDNHQRRRAGAVPVGFDDAGTGTKGGQGPPRMIARKAGK